MNPIYTLPAHQSAIQRCLTLNLLTNLPVHPHLPISSLTSRATIPRLLAPLTHLELAYFLLDRTASNCKAKLHLHLLLTIPQPLHRSWDLPDVLEDTVKHCVLGLIPEVFGLIRN